MDLLYCDESNLEEREGDFFVYGGVAIDGEAALTLSQQIDALRARAGIASNALLKFNPAPDGISHDAFRDVKQAAIETAARHNCRLLVSLILHDLARNPQEARLYEINRVCLHFDYLLRRNRSHGLVLIDRFNDDQVDGHLREKFSIGITGLPYSPQYRLAQIVGFHYSAIGQSNYGSIVDIVLGSFRFAINAFTRRDEKRIDAARRILGILAPFFVRNGDGQVSELSLFFSPKVIKRADYREHYERLRSFLSESGIPAAQKITEHRNY